MYVALWLSKRELLMGILNSFSAGRHRANILSCTVKLELELQHYLQELRQRQLLTIPGYQPSKRNDSLKKLKRRLTEPRKRARSRLLQQRRWRVQKGDPDSKSQFPQASHKQGV